MQLHKCFMICNSPCNQFNRPTLSPTSLWVHNVDDNLSGVLYRLGAFSFSPLVMGFKIEFTLQFYFTLVAQTNAARLSMS